MKASLARSRMLLVPAIVAVASLDLGGCNIGCLFMPCHQSGRVVATVRDPSGAPIEGALVKASTREELTRSDGCAELSTLTYGPGKLAMGWHDVGVSASKDGYKPYTGRKRFHNYRIEITLEPTASSRRSVAVWKTPGEETGEQTLACP